MKKIIITLVVSLVAMFAFSNKANAQYIDDTFRNDSTFVNNPYVRNSAMLRSIEWQKASREERAGRTLFYSGLATQVVGSCLFLVPIQNEEVRYKYNGGGLERIQSTNSVGQIAWIIGGAAVIGGSVMEIIGICKWSSGHSDKRDLIMEYGLRTFVIRF